MRRVSKYASDLALVKGTIFTGNPALRRAQAVAIKGNRIIAVGSEEGILPLVSKATRVIDLGGRFVAPGFNDAHIHLVAGGFSLSRIELRGASTLEDLRARIEGGASRLAPDAWVQGRGWDQTLLPGTVWPPLVLLDEATGDRPALLYRIDGHTAWTNSTAERNTIQERTVGFRDDPAL